VSSTRRQWRLTSKWLTLRHWVLYKWSVSIWLAVLTQSIKIFFCIAAISFFMSTIKLDCCSCWAFSSSSDSCLTALYQLHVLSFNDEWHKKPVHSPPWVKTLPNISQNSVATHWDLWLHYISQTTRNVYWSHASVCVCLCVPCCIPTLLHGPGCNLEEW